MAKRKKPAILSTVAGVCMIGGVFFLGGMEITAERIKPEKTNVVKNYHEAQDTIYHLKKVVESQFYAKPDGGINDFLKHLEEYTQMLEGATDVMEYKEGMAKADKFSNYGLLGALGMVLSGGIITFINRRQREPSKLYQDTKVVPEKDL